MDSLQVGVFPDSVGVLLDIINNLSNSHCSALDRLITSKIGD
jgi:hypothetical protein